MKRSFDLLVALLALTVLSPVLILVAALIRFKLGAPIFFVQDRPGVGGEPFKMIKFRTMHNSRDEQGKLLSDDERLTKFGALLRSTSLDELPGLYNVVKGDMSLVGPRPHPVDDVERYRTSDTRRLLAKPGMTGLWQVAGRSDLSWNDALELDLLYIENWSVVADAAILVRTIQAVLTRSGAY